KVQDADVSPLEDSDENVEVCGEISDTDILAEVLNKNSGSNSSSEGEEETVYIFNMADTEVKVQFKNKEQSNKVKVPTEVDAFSGYKKPWPSQHVKNPSRTSLVRLLKLNVGKLVTNKSLDYCYLAAIVQTFKSSQNTDSINSPNSNTDHVKIYRYKILKRNDPLKTVIYLRSIKVMI
ncbi:hypothetical protein C0J52_26862, partial [Blattella germanica]